MKFLSCKGFIPRKPKDSYYIDFSNVFELVNYMNNISDHLIFKVKKNENSETFTLLVSNFKYENFLKKTFKKIFKINLKDTENIFAFNYKKTLLVQQWSTEGSLGSIKVRTYKILEKLIKNLNQIDNEFEKNIKNYKLEISCGDNYSLTDYCEHEIVTYLYKYKKGNKYELAPYFKIQATKPKRENIDSWTHFLINFIRK